MDQAALGNASASESVCRARAAQLWAMVGRPTDEFLRVNEKMLAGEREHASRDENYTTKDSGIGGIHPRIHEIQTWIMNRLPRQPTEFGHPAVLDFNVHSLWSLFIEAAKRFEPDDPNQCVLAMEMLYLRTVGLRHAFGDEVVPAYASNGKRVFSDLPYLYEDLKFATADESLSRGERANLAAFTARLASCGVLDRELFGLCLLSFREALEVAEVTTTISGGGDDKTTTVTAGHLFKTREMLDALNQWLLLTRHCIEAMVEDGVVDGAFDAADARPGPLAPPSCPAGFGAARWRFWGQRLRDLYRSADPEVAAKAGVCLSWYDSIDTHALGGDNLEPEPGEEKKSFPELKSTAYWVSGTSFRALSHEMGKQ